MGAPVDGLEALVDVAVAVHFAEDAHLVGLKALVHGQIGVLPIADDAQALEALPLPIHILEGVSLAGGTEVGDGHGLVVEALLLDDGALNGHAVVIPAGDVGGVVAAHGVGADNEVLDGLVQGVAHMDIAVGEGRAVVQGEAGLALVLLHQLVIHVQLFPGLQHIRLPLGKAGAHGKIGLRKVQSCVEIF